MRRPSRRWRTRVAAAIERITELETDLAAARTREEAAGLELVDAVAERTQLDTLVAELTTAEAELATRTEALATQRKAVEDHAPAVREAEADLAAIARAEASLVELGPRLAAEQVDVDAWRLLAEAFHRTGIPTLLIESGIPLVEEQANEVLRKLPDTMALQLRTQRITRRARRPTGWTLSSPGRAWSASTRDSVPASASALTSRCAWR